jgi:uncharacterized integral membrane protein
MNQGYRLLKTTVGRKSRDTFPLMLWKLVIHSPSVKNQNKDFLVILFKLIILIIVMIFIINVSRDKKNG